MDTDTAEAAEADGSEDADGSGGLEIDDVKANKGNRRDGKGKGKTSYSGTGKKKWFEMFPAVTKRKKNATKKRKGAVRG